MSKHLLILLCTLLPVLAVAQDNSKYLSGAVPEKDGKVVFTKDISVKTDIAEEALFDIMKKWADENHTSGKENPQDKVLLSSLEDKDIACYGERALVFKKNAFILDQAKISYQLILNIEKNKCQTTIRNIKISYTDRDTPYSAEELISDEVALNKKGDKLTRYHDKFRKHTVDMINKIYSDIDVYLNGITVSGAAGAVQ